MNRARYRRAIMDFVADNPGCSIRDVAEGVEELQHCGAGRQRAVLAVARKRGWIWGCFALKRWYLYPVTHRVPLAYQAAWRLKLAVSFGSEGALFYHAMLGDYMLSRHVVDMLAAYSLSEAAAEDCADALDEMGLHAPAERIRFASCQRKPQDGC